MIIKNVRNCVCWDEEYFDMDIIWKTALERMDIKKHIIGWIYDRFK